jgi:hypothetical protein
MLFYRNTYLKEFQTEVEMEINSLKQKIADRLSTFLFYASIILFLAAFNFRDNPGGWQLQIIPNLNGTTIQDVTFTDSVTGYLATGLNNQLGYIFKTTNGGVNWVIKKTNSYNFQRIIFCGKDTGYCNSYDTLFKTTNAGENWFSIPFPFLTFADDMCALNKDTLWFVMSGMFGGIFRSTNGGYNWTRYIWSTRIWGLSEGVTTDLRAEQLTEDLTGRLHLPIHRFTI